MTIWNIIALIIGGVACLFCLALAIFGAMVFIGVMQWVKDEADEWEQEK